MLFILQYTIGNPCAYVLNSPEISSFAFKHSHIFNILLCACVEACVPQYTRGGRGQLLEVTSFFSWLPQAIMLGASICRHWAILPGPVCILMEKSGKRELGIKMTFKPSGGLYLHQRMLWFLVFFFNRENFWLLIFVYFCLFPGFFFFLKTFISPSCMKKVFNG